MSYDVALKESTIEITEENMKKLMLELSSDKGNGITKEIRYMEDFNYDDIDWNWDSDEGYTLQDIWYDCFGYLIEYEKEEKVYIITEKRYEGFGDADDFFNLIAKYIEDGRYIEFYDYEGESFRLVIKGDKCVWKYPKIVWEDEK